MNRRVFLKSVPGFIALLAAGPKLKGEVNMKGLAVSEDLSIKTEKMPDSNVQELIKLNEPDLKGGISLMQALKKRKSTRAFTDKRLTLHQLSDLLWAADGVNRENGKRTAPAALAMYSVDIYAVLPEGIYLYDVKKHELQLVAEGDHRKTAGTQDFVYSAPLNLVYVMNLKIWQNSRRDVPEETRQKWAIMETGFLSQNVSLYCASEGLGTVVRAGLDHKRFGELIKVSTDKIVLAQTVGNAK